MDQSEQIEELMKELNGSLAREVNYLDTIISMSKLIEGYIVAQEALKVVSPDVVDHLLQTVPAYLDLSAQHDEIMKDPLKYFTNIVKGGEDEH